MIALFLSGVSYSYNFSTIIRVGRRAHLSVDILDGDELGADPLPAYLKRAQLDMGAASTTSAVNADEISDTIAEEQGLVVGSKEHPEP